MDAAERGCVPIAKRRRPPPAFFQASAQGLEPIYFAAIETSATKRHRPPVRRIASMNVAGFVGMTDEELIVHAMRDAQLLLAEHLERGALDAEQAIIEISEIIDRREVIAATKRLCDEFGLRPARSR